MINLSRLSEAQKKANKKWNDGNKERMNYLRNRSAAKSFILKKATEEDLGNIKKYIQQREETLKENEKNEQ